MKDNIHILSKIMYLQNYIILLLYYNYNYNEITI